MKKIIFSTSIIFIMAICSYANSVSESKVPVMVKASFYQDHAEAEHVKWETTAGNDYKATYKTGDDFGSAFYNSNGEFIESDITIEWKEVPLTGRLEIYHSGKGEILNTLKIVNSKKEVFYQIDMKLKNKRCEILLDHAGNIIK